MSPVNTGASRPFRWSKPLHMGVKPNSRSSAYDCIKQHGSGTPCKTHFSHFQMICFYVCFYTASQLSLESGWVLYDISTEGHIHDFPQAHWPKNLWSGIMRKFQSIRDTEHPCNHSNSLLPACVRTARETLTETTLSSMHRNKLQYNRFVYIPHFISRFFFSHGLNYSPLFRCAAPARLSVSSVSCHSVISSEKCFPQREKTHAWWKRVWKRRLCESHSLSVRAGSLHFCMVFLCECHRLIYPLLFQSCDRSQSLQHWWQNLEKWDPSLPHSWRGSFEMWKMNYNDCFAPRRRRHK